MNENELLNALLTNQELAWLDTVRVSLDIGLPETPRTLPTVTTNPKMIPSLLVDARLSEATMKREQKRLALLEKKKASLRNKKPRDKRKRPWTAKQATRRRLLKKQWTQRPMSCLMWSGGAWHLDKELWEKHIAPLWWQWLPEDLKVKRYKGWGTRKKPYTVYTIDVIHKEHGRLYCGNSQLLYDLSCGQQPTCTASKATSSA